MEATVDSEPLEARFEAVRRLSEDICAPLEIEDYVVQTCPDVSPIKWHLAHTSWFFETFILAPFVPGFESPNSKYAELFNSYYHSVGSQFSRPHRGTLARPTVKEIMDYRRFITQKMLEIPRAIFENKQADIASRWELGIHHEQQHQELMLMDLKHIFANNPLLPAYRNLQDWPKAKSVKSTWCEFDGGLGSVGHALSSFAFDNERPEHRVFLEPYALCSELVTQGQFLAFIEDGGYQDHRLWLSDGWDQVQSGGDRHPMYWHRMDDADWKVMTMYGLQELDHNAPVCHVSFFEADAYARWAGHRLPTEFEWEQAAQSSGAHASIAGTLFEDGIFHPVGKPPAEKSPMRHMLGEVWEWTSSAYSPYPGYQPGAGALGEYNGKFMNAQRVLRGGSCVTSQDHLRLSYRNFFQPDKQWQFSGIRLARGTTS
jgi:ergothioneine biosynthesis protein EgtB